MRYASEDLMNEHEGILFGLKILEKMVFMLKEKKAVDVSDAKEMVRFLKLFADKCHHGKEEGLLFPAMEKAGIPNDRGPIGQMLIEHTQGRKYIADMVKSIDADADANNDADDGGVLDNCFIEAAADYIALLRSHINKENMILFPLGDKKIPADVQTQLLSSFEEFEEQVMGKGTHEELHELLSKFERKYLHGA